MSILLPENNLRAIRIASNWRVGVFKTGIEVVNDFDNGKTDDRKIPHKRLLHGNSSSRSDAARFEIKHGTGKPVPTIFRLDEPGTTRQIE